MIILLEGFVMAFWLLLICVVGIANGSVGLVVFYEQDVQDKVVELGLTTKEKIQKRRKSQEPCCLSQCSQSCRQWLTA